LPRKLVSWLYWLLPSLICLWLHRDGLHAWFQADDFAWLGANTEYYDLKTLWPALFRPAAQGTLRPWSERLFFFAFWHGFGWNALPYRMFVLANQCANLLLLSHLVRRISGSGLAGFAAPILWVANAALVVPMAWTSGYNEVLCATFLLSATAIWVQIPTAPGRRDEALYLLQLVIFVLGFGALELNIIYPALAAAYAFFYNRRMLLWTAPMFILSAAYYKLHASLVPLQTSGPYQPHFDLSLAPTLLAYWKLAFLPPYGFITVHPAVAIVMLSIATAGVALFLFKELRAHRHAAAFFACWFLLTLAPLLPFRDHLTHYYLTIPLIGIAAIGGLALARWKTASVFVIALYLAVQLPTLAVGERWYLERSRAARSLVMGVKQVHEWEPAKAILLTGVSGDLYSFTVADSPFRLIPDARVYLAPEALRDILNLPSNLAPVASFALPFGPTRHALLERQLVVYSAAQFPLQEVTAPYTSQTLIGPDPEDPRHVDPGSPLMAYLLGPGWYPLEGPYRWMAKRATLRMGGPRRATDQLYITGFAVRQNLPLDLTVAVDGRALGITHLGPRDLTFTREFPLSGVIGRPEISVSVEVSRTFRPDPHGRELGVVFGAFEIR